MLHRILDQRLNGKDGDEHCQRLFVHVNLSLEAGTDAQPLDFKVSLHDLEFFGELNKGSLRLQEVAEDLGEVEHGFSCCGSLPGNDSVDRVQRIEQKVGVN